MFDWLKRSIAKRAVKGTLAKRLQTAEDSLQRAEHELRAAAYDTGHSKLLLRIRWSCLQTCAAYVIRCFQLLAPGRPSCFTFAGPSPFTFARWKCCSCVSMPGHNSTATVAAGVATQVPPCMATTKQLHLSPLWAADASRLHAGGAPQLTARQAAALRQRQAQQPECRSLASRASTTALQAAQGAKQLVAPIASSDHSLVPGGHCVSYSRAL